MSVVANLPITAVEGHYLKIKPLSGEAFRPYGQVLERGALVYLEADEGRVALEMLEVRRRPDAHQIAQLAIHFSYITGCEFILELQHIEM